MPGSRLRHSLTIGLALAGLLWGIVTLPRSEDADQFRRLNTELLRSENFSLRDLANKLSASNLAAESGCDSDQQTALLTIEMRLADTALHSGDSAAFDRHSLSVAQRAKRALSCTPRQSFIWLIAFSQAVLSGKLDDDTLKMLSLSYQTSPNEGWISVRRNFVATPLIPILPPDLRDSAEQEFEQLVADGFEAEAAKSFVRAQPAVQTSLQARLQHLAPARQEAFQTAVHQLGF